MKQISLNKGKVTIVDDEYFEILNRYNWGARKSGIYNITFYASRTYVVNKRTVNINMHRYIWFLKTGECPIGDLDHIDGDRLNNLVENLRLASDSQNQGNQRIQKIPNKSSIYKGVYWKKQSQKWVTQIGMNGKRIHIGYFISEEDAARAYNKAAKKYFGEYAELNVIP